MNGYIEKKLAHSVWMVCAIYTVAGIFWILVSDHLLVLLADPYMASRLQLWKGILFIVINAAFLYVLVSRKNEFIKKLFRETRNQMQHFQATFEQAAVGIVHISKEEEWIRVNQAICDLLDYDHQAFKSLSLEDIVHPEDLDKGREMDQKLISGKLDSYVMEKRFVKKTGEAVYTRLTKSAVRGVDGELQYLIGIIEQISAQKEAEEELRQLLREKDRLLAEVHHRVKNNLAIVSGLMELQIESLENRQVRQILQRSMMRIKSMALIHEAYYEQGKLAHVMVNTYLRNFVHYIEKVRLHESNQVEISLNALPLKLNINQALPCGLLISEFLVYACEHVNSLSEIKSTINIVITSKGELVTIQVSGRFGSLNDTSLGMTIIRALVNQLEATLNIEEKMNITRFIIAFQRQEMKKGSSNAYLSSGLHD